MEDRLKKAKEWYINNCPTPIAYRWIKREIQSRNPL